MQLTKTNRRRRQELYRPVCALAGIVLMLLGGITGAGLLFLFGAWSMVFAIMGNKPRDATSAMRNRPIHGNEEM